MINKIRQLEQTLTGLNKELLTVLEKIYEHNRILFKENKELKKTIKTYKKQTTSSV